MGNKPVTDPGVKRGDCPGGVGSTPTYLRDNYPDGYVTFKNAAVGEIGSTVSNPNPPTPSPITPTPAPTKTPTKSPTFQKDATLLISRIVFPLPLVQVINSAIKYGCPTEPRITSLLWEENVLPTRLVAVDQPNVLVAAAMLLAFHRPTLHPLLHSHQLLLSARFVTIVGLLQ